MGMDKLTVCICEALDNHGQWLIERLPLHLILEKQQLYFYLQPQSTVWNSGNSQSLVKLYWAATRWIQFSESLSITTTNLRFLNFRFFIHLIYKNSVPTPFWSFSLGFMFTKLEFLVPVFGEEVWSCQEILVLLQDQQCPFEQTEHWRERERAALHSSIAPYITPQLF